MSRANIAKTLKRLRDQSGYTTNEVGAMVGKSGKTVSGWENDRGQPDAEILMQLCEIYKVDNILDEFQNDIKKAPLAENEEHGKLLGEINALIRDMDEKQLERFLRVTQALRGGQSE